MMNNSKTSKNHSFVSTQKDYLYSIVKNIGIAAFILLIVVSGGCKQSDTQSDDFITVDVTANYPKKELILQDFMDVEYIPLETNDEFITSGHIRAIGKEMIIVNNRTPNPYNIDGDLFIFDRNGNSLNKINRSGQGSQEYMNIGGIILDEENSEIFVNSHYTSKIYVYDLLGNFKRSFGHKEGSFYFPICNLNKNHLICVDGNSNSDSDEIKRNRFIIISKQDGSIIKEIQIPYKEKKSPRVTTINANGRKSSRLARNQELVPYLDSWIRRRI